MVEKQEIVRHFCHSARRTIKIYNQQNEPTNERIANNGKGWERKGEEGEKRGMGYQNQKPHRAANEQRRDRDGTPKKELNKLSCSKM